jgi:hypothetical protein
MADVYELKLEIPDQALGAIAPGCRIAIARACGNAEPNIVWAALEPARRSTVTWDGTYGLHASAVPSGNLMPLRILGIVFPARERAIYPFSGGAFGLATDGRRIPSQHYNVRNDSPEALAFGLTASATVDGTESVAPLNAVVVPARFNADFCGGDKVYAWLQPGAVAGTIVAPIPSYAAVITYEQRRRTARLRYDAPANAFIIQDPLPPSR